MKSDKYIGMDVHQATIVVAVVDADGKLIWENIIATQAGAIMRLLQSLNGRLHVTFEETTQAQWLYEVVRAWVAEVIVCDPRRNKLLSEGSKADKVDARRLAELLRVGMVRGVYHGIEGSRNLKQLAKGYQTLVSDMQRTMTRIKAIYRGRGIGTGGRGVYQPKQRNKWLEQLTEPGIRQRAAWLYEQLDQLGPLRRQAKQALLKESRKHRAASLLRTIPQLGPIRSALIIAVIDTPHRFRTRQQLWSYSGLAVVTHMSAEYEIKEGRIVRSRKPMATRGLNRNCNRILKDIFISAAVAGSSRDPYRSYVLGLEQRGIRKEMARLTLARKISSIALTIWKKGEAFDPKKLNWAT